MGLEIDPRLIGVVVEEVPALIAWIRDIYKSKHPDAPSPTDAEVLAAYHEAVASTLAKDAAWKAAHPEPPQ